MSQHQKGPSSEEDWVIQELGGGVHFGDQRLNRRFEKIAKSFSKHPSKSINHAVEDWAATKAAYRFFDNPKVSAEKILSAHLRNTVGRVEAQERIVMVQDTSVLDFTRHHKTKGLGMTAKSKADEEDFECKGLLLHTALAMTSSGLPLGLLSHQIWVREEDRPTKKSLGKHAHYSLPIEQKESFRWLRALRETHERIRQAQVIVVADREADIYELFAEAEESGVDLVIRQHYDRMLVDEELGCVKVSERLAAKKSTAQVSIKVSSNGKRRARTAVLDIKHLDVHLSSDGRGIKNERNRDRQDLGLHVVELREVNPPQGVTPLHWVLWTTFVVTSDEDALAVANFYRMRWTIEEYFKCLKTGCNVEDTRLMEAEKIIKYVSLLSIIAWRIMWMTIINRTDPDAGCEAVFTKHEWQALWLLRNKRQIKAQEISPHPPSEAPTIHEAVRWLAMQGGFLGRKGDGEPGMITIWRGWLELFPAVEMYESLLPHLKKQTHIL